MFSLSDNRKIRVNGTKEPIEFKSNQWFGATVKAHKGKVVVSINRVLVGLLWNNTYTEMFQNSYLQKSVHVRTYQIFKDKLSAFQKKVSA